MANLAYYRNTLATLSQGDIELITSYVKAGAGAHGIHCETPYSIKQINAVFALVNAPSISKEQLRIATRLWLQAEGFDPDADDAHLRQSHLIDYFANNYDATRYTRSFIKKAQERNPQ